MAYVLGVAAYVYERQLQAIPARWTMFWGLFGVGVVAVFLLSEHPIGWIISHLTLDPETGFYRILIWDAALERIGQSPMMGYSFQLFAQDILDATVDCVWLVEALRYGIPTSAFLFWANMAAVWPAHRGRFGAGDDFDQRMSLAFTIVLLLFVFSGITVHFWNYMWIFWACALALRPRCASAQSTVDDPIRDLEASQMCFGQEPSECRAAACETGYEATGVIGIWLIVESPEEFDDRGRWECAHERGLAAA